MYHRYVSGTRHVRRRRFEIRARRRLSLGVMTNQWPCPREILRSRLGFCRLFRSRRSHRCNEVAATVSVDEPLLIKWLEADVLTAPLPRAAFSVWHDRAVFHFLTAAEDRSRYVAQVRKAVR